MLKITLPPNLKSARKYILNVLLTEFLGIPFHTENKNISTIKIYYNNKTLTIADIFFQQAADHWLQPKSLPALPLAQWHVNLADINLVVPVIFGENVYLEKHDNGLHLGLDIFGSAFFMLTRYEEAVKSERDAHNRFPATASLAYQADFLHRPIVNEYLEILWACMKQLWPQLKRKPRQFRTLVSHDVDLPYLYPFMTPIHLGLRMGGDLLFRRSLKQAVQRIPFWIQSKRGHVENDPHNTFDHIMDLSEQHNIQSAFYFITAHSAGKIDGNYNIEHPLIRRLIHHISERGHEIGLHTSYNTYQNPAQTLLEFQKLRKVCEGIKQEKWGGRQHCLRWETPTTFRNWDNAGLDYDSTLSFADMAGFRCGTCYEYPTYDVVANTALQVRERPLIVMECSVIDEHYMNLGRGGKAYLLIKKLKESCRQYNGDFTLLWHNSRFVNHGDAALYKAVLEA